jgi:large subunit ribosomal protein L18
MATAKINRKLKREGRQTRVRKQVRGTAEKPRLCVFRSLTATYVQAISDTTGEVIAAASTKSISSAAKSKKGVESATALGKEVAKQLISKNVTTVTFDRNGYQFHGRVKAVAEGAREAGLVF